MHAHGQRPLAEHNYNIIATDKAEDGSHACTVAARDQMEKLGPSTCNSSD